MLPPFSGRTYPNDDSPMSPDQSARPIRSRPRSAGARANSRSTSLAQTVQMAVCVALPLASTCATSLTALLALSTLINLPPPTDCEALDPSASDRARLTCLRQAIADENTDAILEALDWVGSWDMSHPLFYEGLDLVDTWSTRVLEIAYQHQNNGDVSAAIALARHIPIKSPHFRDAQGLLRNLETSQKEAANALYAEAQVALKNQAWAEAFQLLWQLQDRSPGSRRAGLAQQLSQQIEAERQAQRLLNKAMLRYSAGTNEKRRDAIAIASQIDPSTYVWKTAHPLLTTWKNEPVLWSLLKRHRTGLQHRPEQHYQPAFVNA